MSHPVARGRRLAQAAVAAAAVLMLVPAAASALTVSRAELRSGQLRVEGTTAFVGATVVAHSSFSTASARTDSQGRFKIEVSGFRSDDCTAVVSDGFSPIAIPTLSGCTPVAPTPVGENPPPTGSCVVDAPAAPATFNVGDFSSEAFTTTGCAAPVQWTVVAGTIPPGMGPVASQDQTGGVLSGVPVKEGTYDFTLRATDATGATDQRTFTVTIQPPRPLTPCCISPIFSTSVGQGVDTPLLADGGLPGYDWSLVAGALPPGVRIIENELTGVPTTPGTYSFTLRVTDSRGTTADEDFTFTVTP